MKIYHFNTLLTFGKHRNKSIRQLIEEKEYSYLIQFLLRKTNKACFTEEVFNEIKHKDVPKATLEDFIEIKDKTQITQIVNERDLLKLEVINLKKMLSYYKNKDTKSYSKSEIHQDYEQENTNWLAEAAGTDDPETMNDVYWNLD